MLLHREDGRDVFESVTGRQARYPKEQPRQLTLSDSFLLFASLRNSLDVCTSATLGREHIKSLIIS